MKPTGIPGTSVLQGREDVSLDADTTPPLGKGQGFRPHELLEAALASFMAITLRMVAREREIALEQA